MTMNWQQQQQGWPGEEEKERKTTWKRMMMMMMMTRRMRKGRARTKRMTNSTRLKWVTNSIAVLFWLEQMREALSRFLSSVELVTYAKEQEGKNVRGKSEQREKRPLFVS